MTERAVGHLPDDDPQADRLTAAIRAGDLETLARLLQEHPQLAAMRIGSDDESRSTLHDGDTLPNFAPSIIGPGASLSVYSGQTGGQHVLYDLTGWFLRP